MIRGTHKDIARLHLKAYACWGEHCDLPPLHAPGEGDNIPIRSWDDCRCWSKNVPCGYGEENDCPVCRQELIIIPKDWIMKISGINNCC